MRTFPASPPSHPPSVLLITILLVLLAPPFSRAQETMYDPITGDALDTLENQKLKSWGFQYSDVDGSRILRTFGDLSTKYYKKPLVWLKDLFEYRQEYTRTPTPSGQGGGFKNWNKLAHGPSSFSKRNGHASAVYRCPPMYPVKDTMCLWITGGRSEEYQGFDLEFTRRNADVFYSPTGAEWSQVDNLRGDYIDGIGNFDAKFPGKRAVAPWYSRYGHSLNPLDIDGDGKDDAIVIIGGFSPEASNDIWISADGVTWAFDGYAPFTARAWHATSVFKGRLYVIGGTPLTNDVWTGNLTMKSGFNCGETKNKQCSGVYSEAPNGFSSGYNMTMIWQQRVKHMETNLPFSPRSGHCLITQTRRNDWNNTLDLSTTDRMFLVGGFASWPVDDPRYDAERSRNDIYETLDGKNWTKLEPPLCPHPPCDATTVQPPSMPWGARAWHGCATLHDPQLKHVDLSESAQFDYYNEGCLEYEYLGDRKYGKCLRYDGEIGNKVMHPKMYIVGGGYIGSKRNHVVRKMEAYVDIWFSRDGTNWTKVNYQEGRKESLFTTQDWAQTSVEDVDVFIGKWGFTMEVFNRTEDLDGNGILEPSNNVEFDFAGTRMPDKDPSDPTYSMPTQAAYWKTINWKHNR